MSQTRDIWQFYALVALIEQALIDAKESDWSVRLSTAIHGGFTSGEILGRVGIELRALLSSDVPRRAGIEAEVVEADRFVTEALRPG